MEIKIYKKISESNNRTVYLLTVIHGRINNNFVDFYLMYYLGGINLVGA